MLHSFLKSEQYIKRTSYLNRFADFRLKIHGLNLFILLYCNGRLVSSIRPNKIIQILSLKQIKICYSHIFKKGAYSFCRMRLILLSPEAIRGFCPQANENAGVRPSDRRLCHSCLLFSNRFRQSLFLLRF